MRKFERQTFINQLSDLKVAKLLEVEENQNDCADKFNAKNHFLMMKIPLQ